jgi:error-prone DNA polymerase
LKVDLLGLGMLTVIARTFELVSRPRDAPTTMATVPAEDPFVYDMICDADTIGTFQSREPRAENDAAQAQAALLLRPGDRDRHHSPRAHRRGDGAPLPAATKRARSPSRTPRKTCAAILARTLGVPLFQEQAMKLSMVAAGFSPGEADALAAGAVEQARATSGCPRSATASSRAASSAATSATSPRSCFESFKGFSHYGFPESHAASFALIAYASCWLKKYYPAIFTAALLDAQPMGFYAPHTLVDDARRHGV